MSRGSVILKCTRVPSATAPSGLRCVEFLELKKDWVKEYGSQASQKEFHKAVLDVGPAPFKVVEKYIGRELDN